MKQVFITNILIFGAMLVTIALVSADGWGSDAGAREPVKLPHPELDGKCSLEKALQQRRSVREYSSEALTLAEVSQLLWAAQGISSRYGYRTAPSAGALFPLELYLVAGDVDSLPAGVYRYDPHGHQLLRVADGEHRIALTAATLNQSCVRNAPAVIVLAAVYERTTGKYRDRGIRYVHMEAGHAAQNVHLEAVSLKLATVVIGAFYDEKVQKILGLSSDEAPLIIMPVGKRR